MARITTAEWPIMKVLWEKETATAAEIVSVVTAESGSSMRTVKALIRRLIAKKTVAYTIDEKDSRIYHYTAVVSREEGMRRKDEDLLSLVYDNKPGELLAHFVENNRLAKTEIEKLQWLLKQKIAELEDEK